MTAPTKKRAARRPLPLPKKSHKSQERVVDSTDDEETTITTTETEAGTKTDTDSGSGSGSGSDSDSDSDSDTERDEPSTAPKSTSAYSYAPPPQFSLVPPSTSTRSNPFSARNLAGKELWLISAPLAAPLSKLTVLNLADVAAGAPTLQTGSGKQYCLRMQDAESVEVAVHDGHGGYCIAGKQIARSFRVVEALPTPAPAVPDSAPKKVRTQPDGLWMRFKPIGYVGAQGEDANVKTDEVEVEVEVEVRGHGGEEQKRKRRREDGERGEKKKHRSREKHGSRSAVASYT